MCETRGQLLKGLGKSFPNREKQVQRPCGELVCLKGSRKGSAAGGLRVGEEKGRRSGGLWAPGGNLDSRSNRELLKLTVGR